MFYPLGSVCPDYERLYRPASGVVYCQSEDRISQAGSTAARAVCGNGTRVKGPRPLVIVIDDDRSICDGIRELCEGEGYTVEAYRDCELFLENLRSESAACLLVDAYLPGISGIELLEFLEDTGRAIPSIVITGKGDVRTAVTAMKAGALDYIQKPVSSATLLVAIAQAVALSIVADSRREDQDSAAVKIGRLTPRQHEIMDLVLAGHPSKNIAADLGISQRTVENHRAMIMRRTGSASMPALARLAVSAGPKKAQHFFPAKRAPCVREPPGGRSFPDPSVGPSSQHRFASRI